MRYCCYLVLLISAPAVAQVNISLSTGYSSYSMKEMKSFQKELQADFPEGSRVTETFPDFLYYDLAVTTEISDQFILGGFIRYGSTGGRIHYSDYSGEVRGDQLIQYVSLGSPLGMNIYKNEEKSFSVHADLRPQLSYCFLNLEFYSRLDTQDEAQSLKFTAFNVSLEPGFTAEKYIRHWGINFFAGYHLNLVKGNLMFKEIDQAYLQNKDGDPVHVSLSGLRISLGISYRIGQE